MDSEYSQTNLVIITRRDRLKIFCKMYWRALVIITTPLVLLPVAVANHKNAYKCFYVFLVTITYWITDVLHPSVVALVPIAVSSVMASIDHGILKEMYIRNELLDCIGVMMILVAIEHSQLHRRIALKLLLIFGCSHYRLSFLLFFTTTFLSMWISNIMACGLMMPIVKAVLTELEKMGILEIYQVIGKARQHSNRHEQDVPRPTDFTVFYFLGIAYSSSIGGIATIMGSQTNQIFQIYCEKIFPLGPKIEFPHFMLLNLPGVLVMETLLYMWMNFYFLGMFRAHSDIALEIGLSEEEAHYIDTLLATEYNKLGKVKFHEGIVGVIVLLNGLLQATISAAYFDSQGYSDLHNHFNVSSPCILCVILLFITPVNTNFLKFFQRSTNDTTNEPLPNTPSKACLNWELITNNLNWSVIFIIGGSATLFESLRDSRMTDEMENFLLLFRNWPASALVLVVILFCKILTEFASNSCVAYCLLPNIARLSVTCHVNPHYLMMAGTLSCSLSFHLVTGTPVNAMVCAYVHIAPWKMMYAGIGPSIIAIVVTWFTVAAWSTAIWADINIDPAWADINIFNKNV